jgi:uncharacterized membrane protein YeaQ/YmgE (transglycosylase-associated protein family)
MADEGTGNDSGKGTGGGKGVLGDLVKAESMLQVAIALPAGCLIGWFAGSWLDRHFHQGWISIAGIVLGAIGGFVQIFNVASSFLKKDKS